MSDRREALRARFKARALDRLRQVTVSLVEMEAGRGDESAVNDLARELHTLKGDSRMLGFSAVSEVAHAAEDRLATAKQSGTRPDAATCAVLLKELDVVACALRGELGDEQATHKALAEAKERLAGRPTQPSPPGSSESGGEPVTSAGPCQAARPPSPPTGGEEHPVDAAAARKTDEGAAEERWVQVNASKLDELCERVFEFAAEFRALAAAAGSAGTSSNGSGREALRGLVEDFDRRRSQLEDLTSAAWALRLAPVEPTLQDLVKHARDLARAQGKRVRVVVEASGAEVERTVLDDLREPLLHLIRNAVDHGVEPPEGRGDKPVEATLGLRAEPVGPSVAITVADDGRGVDEAAVRQAAVARGLVGAEAARALTRGEVFDFLFRHGFSTRGQVSDVSGRGVGLDVVRQAVDRLGGSVAVASELGRGTRFTLTVPSALSRERALVVACDDALYALPSRNVAEVVRRAELKVTPVAGGEAVTLRGESIPLRSLSAALGHAAAAEPWLAILDVGGRRLAFGVPAFLGEHELVRRPVDAVVARLGPVPASATLDDGRLVLFLTLAPLARAAPGRPLARAVAGALRRRRVLVVDDSPMARDLVAEILSGLGLEVQVASDGGQAVGLLEVSPPDLVVADVEMPVMDGFELLRRIRTRWEHLPVVMLTTRGSAADRRAAADLGASAYLIKSEFEEARLVDTVRRLIAA